jgi:hypothetical protein
MCNPQSYVKVCVCENEGLRILVKWVYEQNQVTMREFVNLNISRSILIGLVMNIANNNWKMFTKMRFKSH